MMDGDAKHIGLLAKIPTHGDFVRMHTTSPVWRAFDTWIQEGFFLAQQKNAFQEGYMNAEGYAFLFTPGQSDPSLVGFLQPSQDQIGRKFPVLIGMEEDTHQSSETLKFSPVHHAAFLEKARELAQKAAAGQVGHHQLIEAIEAWTPTEGIDARASYQTYLKDTTWKRFVEGLFDRFEDPRKYLLFKNIEEILAPLASGVPPQYTLGFRFPALADSSPALFQATFWLNVFFGKLTLEDMTPCLFWRSGPVATQRTSVLIYLRPPAARELPHMLPSESESDHICDMDQMGLRHVASAGAALTPSLKQLLDDPEMTLLDLLLRYE